MSPHIRVVQIIPGIAIGDQSGGAELYAVQISRLFPKDIFNPAVFVMTQFGSLSEQTWLNKLAEEGIMVAGFIQPKSSTNNFLREVFRSLWSFTSNFQPDIINSHTERGDLLNVLIHLLHPVHPKTVRTVHIDKQWVTHPKIGAFLNKIIFPLTINRETAVSETITKQLNRRWITRLKNNDVRLIHNGIDESFFKSHVQSLENSPLPDGIPEVHPRIGIIGRLTDQKGHADLLAALKSVLDKFRAYLFIIGSGPLEPDLEQISHELGLSDYVYFLGNRNDVMEILPHLEMVVSASLWEGFPTVLLEAMSQGVPVIATDISGSCELIQSGSTGILVPPANPQVLADAIKQLLNDPDTAREMGKRARVFASQFTIQNTAKYHASLYEGLTTN